MNLILLKECLLSENVIWKKHVLQRLAERRISQDAVLQGLFDGLMIREYPEDKPFASALFLTFIENIPLHIVASLDEAGRTLHIITAYYPSLEWFEEDYKTRKN